MAAQNIGRMDARSASRMLLGYASLGFAPPPQLAASLLEKATVDTRRTSSYDLIDIMWAVAVLDMHRHDPAVAAKVFSSTTPLQQGIVCLTADNCAFDRPQRQIVARSMGRGAVSRLAPCWC